MDTAVKYAHTFYNVFHTYRLTAIEY